MKLLRRLHLYLGLFLFPWALLYGVSAFLFNHPATFSEQPMVQFGPSVLKGTPFENRPSPGKIAEEVVRKLNESQKPEVPYELAGEAKFNREFAFATIKAEGRTLGLLIDPKTGSGTVRETVPVKPKSDPPFLVGRLKQEQRTKTSPPAPISNPNGLFLDESPAENLKGSIPTILERTGFPSGEVTVTSMPEIAFPIRAEGRVWLAVYNPMTGSVEGTPNEELPTSELGWRSFMLRLHKAHGYPGETNGRWWWAVVVDAMAVVLVFWGLSGLLMWWQIKSTRILGLIVLVVSAVAATSLGVAMYAAMRG